MSELVHTLPLQWLVPRLEMWMVALLMLPLVQREWRMTVPGIQFVELLMLMVVW
jgi:hypothetical protein